EASGAGVSGQTAADPTPVETAQRWSSQDPIPLPMWERREDDEDVIRINLEEDTEMLHPPMHQQVARVDTHETQSGELICSWDTGDMDNFPTNHPMWTAEAFIIHPAVVKVSRNVFQKKFKQLMKVNRKMVDFAIEQLAQSRRAAQLIPLALTLPEEERSTAVRRSADELPVTNYKLDGSKEGSFYEVGMDLPSAMRCVLDTHHWDPEYDLAWAITEAGNDVEGASGRPTADTLNDV
ncbi:MAG: hypothetical protein GY768_16490, partial [Planctomycetaceae bacterium]|nr:hypothetical protein [Planctomycetaceae bacterium]